MLKEYSVVGRRVPSETHPNPVVMKMTIFADNEVVAKSRFWYYVSRLHKVKKSVGQILQCKEIPTGNTTSAKNYVVRIRYNSRSGTHNMRREYRDVSRVGAIEQMYTDMASRHQVRKPQIHVLSIEETPAAECVRAAVREYHDSNIKFPLVRPIIRAADPYYKKRFRTERPNLPL
ncbi:hypothetical protein RCL1_006707 [Eukaryota sp. TZLM3-RCL]